MKDIVEYKKVNDKLLVVYNICGIKGDDRDRLNYYLAAIESIHQQDFKHFHLAISSCLNSDYICDSLTNFSDIFIRYPDPYPVNVTFNKTVDLCVQKYGEFNSYIFIDSGILLTRPDVLKNLYNESLSDAVMVSVGCDTDTGITDWFPEFGNNIPSKFRVGLDKALNLHCQLFSNEIRQKFGRILPDLFESYGTECSFPSICSSLNKKWIHLNDVVVEHRRGMDGPSSAFSGGRHDAVYRRPENIFQIMFSIEAMECGIGYEGFRGIKMADRSKYDKNEYAIDDKLFNFIKDNLYLPKEYLDYVNIKYETK